MIHNVFTNSIQYKLISIQVDSITDAKLLNIHNHATIELLYIISGDSSLYVNNNYKRYRRMTL